MKKLLLLLILTAPVFADSITEQHLNNFVNESTKPTFTENKSKLNELNLIFEHHFVKEQKHEKNVSTIPVSSAWIFLAFGFFVLFLLKTLRKQNGN